MLLRRLMDARVKPGHDERVCIDSKNCHNFAFPRHDMPEVCYHIPALCNQRARGGRAPDAPDSRVCNYYWQKRTRVSQVTPASPGIPRAMVYSL